MVNVKQVAALAGVSHATVSRALSSPERLRAETLDRVQQAIAQLGYVPSDSARSLRMGRSHAVGVVAPTLLNELHARSIEVLERALHRQGLAVLLSWHRDDRDAEFECVRTLLGRRVDALVLLGAQHHPELLPMLDRRGVPSVQCWAIDPERARPSVGYDNRAAMRRVAEHLIALGHRRLAVLAGPAQRQHVARQRLAGVKDVLVEAGVALAPAQVVESGYDVDEIRGAVRGLMTRRAAPTALVCVNDMVAAAAIAECHALGRAVPGEVSVTGFGDWQLAQLITPLLTTVRSDAVRIGELTADSVIARLRDGAAGAVAPVHEIDAPLVVRDSTSPPGG